MNDSVFVDTNVFVYSRDASEPAKMERAREVIRDLWVEKRGRVSVQVLNEYYVTVTQKLKPGLTSEEAWDDVHDLMVWKPLPLDLPVMKLARLAQQRHVLSWWDALIVASASAMGCGVLLSEDLSSGHVYLDVAVQNPFSD